MMISAVITMAFDLPLFGSKIFISRALPIQRKLLRPEHTLHPAYESEYEYSRSA